MAARGRLGWLFYLLLDISGIMLGIFLIAVGWWTWSGRSLPHAMHGLILSIGIAALAIHTGHYFGLFGKDTSYFYTRRHRNR